jgi:hypothetical protein
VLGAAVAGLKKAVVEERRQQARRRSWRRRRREGEEAEGQRMTGGSEACEYGERGWG